MPTVIVITPLQNVDELFCILIEPISYILIDYKVLLVLKYSRTKCAFAVSMIDFINPDMLKTKLQGGK